MDMDHSAATAARRLLRALARRVDFASVSRFTDCEFRFRICRRGGHGAAICIPEGKDLSSTSASASDKRAEERDEKSGSQKPAASVNGRCEGEKEEDEEEDGEAEKEKERDEDEEHILAFSTPATITARAALIICRTSPGKSDGGRRGI
mmetsp:Transcript_4318/g.7707  ORF Transcript_4318/g.7707 Transcript_4318/m.7707 type:complete len:149 (-) Transcript_4318:467-913(-)